MRSVALAVFAVAVFLAHQSLAAPAIPDTVGIIRAGQFTPPANQPEKSAYIELRHRRQEPNLCVPTAACIILQKFGNSTSPRELKDIAEGRKFDPLKEFKDFTPLLFPKLIKSVATLGFTWTGQSYPPTKEGFASGITTLKQSLDKGNPVLVDTTLFGGHTFIIAGYNEDAQNLIIMDPNIPAPGIRVLAYPIFEQIWNSRGAGFNHRAAVFTSRKK